MSETPPPDELQARLQDFRARFDQLKTEIQKAIIGQEEIVEKTLLAIIAGGHVLLEGVPGLGKTLLVRSLASALHLTFQRVQFTPDLMPADLIGTKILVDDGHGHSRFEFAPGPVFCNLLLGDEINRATPKTQSALLEPRCSRRCRSKASRWAVKRASSKNRSSFSPRRIRSKWRARILCPRRSSTGSSSSSR